MARPLPSLLLALVAAFTLACAEEPTGLRVVAAASLTDVVEGLAAEHADTHGAQVLASVGASSTLARQIADGLPADVFVSAHRRWIDALAGRDLLMGEPVAVARNRLVCIVPARAGEAPRDARELADLVALPGLIAVASEGVPAGDYARQALDAAGVAAQLAPRLVGQRDVRAVVSAVARGEVAAGLVYATDARAAADDVLVAFAVDAALHEPVVLWAAALRDAADPALARAFVDALNAADARAVFDALGFEAP